MSDILIALFTGAQDLIASLTQRLEQAEKRGGHSAHIAPSSMTPEPTEDRLALAEMERELERERADAKKRERKLQDQGEQLPKSLSSDNLIETISTVQSHASRTN